jgi:tetratricopeptide (TPR) repeat protein
LTRTGATVGTSGYMSPEQVRREHLDGRTDLFSLGLVIYEMTTGRRAFTGESALAVQEAILTTSPPKVDAVNPAVPHELAAIVGTAIEKERSLRYQSAANLRRDLERARATLSQPTTHRPWRWLPGVATAAALALVLGAIWFVAQSADRVTLSPNDTILLAEPTNTTSDRVFDNALLTALRFGLEQTPYLNVLADDKIRAIRADLGLDPTAPFTPEVALDACRRSGSRIVIATTISDAGNRLAVEVDVIDCVSGAVVSSNERAVASRDHVVAALGDATIELRRTLGEPAESIDQYDAPLADATSASLEALELLRLGYRRQLEGDVQGAVPYYERATRVDPSFALAHAALSIARLNMGDVEAAKASGQAAMDLRERMTVPGRFHVESNYHLLISGDREQAVSVLDRWVRAFPLDMIARNNLGQCLLELGQPDEALGHVREVARLRPIALTYARWINTALITDRADEAQSAMDDALSRGFDTPWLRDEQVRLAFLRRDEAAMERQWEWSDGRPEAHTLFYGRAHHEAYHGRIHAALRFAQTASEMAAAMGQTRYTDDAALWQVDVGLPLTWPVDVSPSAAVSARVAGTTALARLGRIEAARLAAHSLDRDFPTHTSIQKVALPTIEGAIELASDDPAGAIAALAPVEKYDLAYNDNLEPLYPVYLRGLAYLDAGDGAQASAQFQKMLAHPGLIGRSVLIPLARLQLARAQRAMRADAAALASYETVLEIWKDADADIPAFLEAKAEHRALRDRLAMTSPRQ